MASYTCDVGVFRGCGARRVPPQGLAFLSGLAGRAPEAPLAAAKAQLGVAYAIFGSGLNSCIVVMSWRWFCNRTSVQVVSELACTA